MPELIKIFSIVWTCFFTPYMINGVDYWHKKIVLFPTNVFDSFIKIFPQHHSFGCTCLHLFLGKKSKKNVSLKKLARGHRFYSKHMYEEHIWIYRKISQVTSRKPPREVPSLSGWCLNVAHSSVCHGGWGTFGWHYWLMKV